MRIEFDGGAFARGVEEDAGVGEGGVALANGDVNAGAALSAGEVVAGVADEQVEGVVVLLQEMEDRADLVSVLVEDGDAPASGLDRVGQGFALGRSLDADAGGVGRGDRGPGVHMLGRFPGEDDQAAHGFEGLEKAQGGFAYGEQGRDDDGAVGGAPHDEAGQAAAFADFAVAGENVFVTVVEVEVAAEEGIAEVSQGLVVFFGLGRGASALLAAARRFRWGG